MVLVITAIGGMFHFLGGVGCLFVVVMVFLDARRQN